MKESLLTLFDGYRVVELELVCGFKTGFHSQNDALVEKQWELVCAVMEFRLRENGSKEGE